MRNLNNSQGISTQVLPGAPNIFKVLQKQLPTAKNQLPIAKISSKLLLRTCKTLEGLLRVHHRLQIALMDNHKRSQEFARATRSSQDFPSTMLQKLSKCEVKAWLCWNLIIVLYSHSHSDFMQNPILVNSNSPKMTFITVLETLNFEF